MPKKKPKRISAKKTASPWVGAPVVRPGVLTQIRKKREVIVIDPQNKRAYVIQGTAAELWLMLERGLSADRVRRALTRGLNEAKNEALERDVRAFFSKILLLKLARKPQPTPKTR